MLESVQQDLFDLGADLATPATMEGALRIAPEAVGELEDWIDDLNEDLPPLREFILPGGGPVGSFLHQARTVCRRGEREVLTLMDHDPDVGTAQLRYLNRLSDFLFVLGRWAAKGLGEPEYFWQRSRSRQPKTS
jgi:cob(I)alamin adenosyltransferase